MRETGDYFGTKLSRRWKALPLWVRLLAALPFYYLAFFIMTRGFDYLSSALGDSDISFFIVAVAFISVTFLFSTLVTLRTEKPRELLRQVDRSEEPRARKKRKWLLVSLAVGALACIGLVWFVQNLLNPGDAGKHLRIVGVAGAILAFVLFGLPLAGTLTLVGLGKFRPHGLLRCEYTVQVSAALEEVWKARSDATRFPEYGESVVRVESLNEPGQEKYRLVGNLFRRFVAGSNCTMQIANRQPQRMLTAITETSNGDWERTRMTFAPAGSDTTEVAFQSETIVGSAFIRGFATFAGMAHLARGGAETEARRFRQLLGVDAQVCGFKFEYQVSEPDEVLKPV